MQDVINHSTAAVISTEKLNWCDLIEYLIFYISYSFIFPHHRLYFLDLHENLQRGLVLS